MVRQTSLGDLSDIGAEQLAMIKALPPLLSALLNISLAHNWLKTTLNVIKLQPSFVQALPANASPLAQLSGINPEKGVEIEIVQGAEGKKWVEKFVKGSNGEKPGKLVAGEFTEAVNVAKWWPRLEITEAEFRGRFRDLHQIRLRLTTG
jgi:translocation protein SEC63